MSRDAIVDEEPESPELWLNRFVTDTESGEVLMEWPSEPLPEGLRPTQLPGFLAQRHGEPLPGYASDLGDTFAAPESLWTRKALTVAVALVANDEDGALVPLYQRLFELTGGLRDLDPALLADDNRGLAPEWPGPLFDAPSLVQSANHAAGRAGRAWLVGSALASEIQQAAAGSPPVPTPGLPALRDGLQQSMVLASDHASALADGCERLHKATKARDAERALLARYDAAIVAAHAAERHARGLAQLAFGVLSCRANDPHLQRLERAAVAVLHPPEGHGSRGLLRSDGVRLAARTRDELAVEVAGLVCRLLVDRGTRATLSADGCGPVTIDVDASDTLLVSHKGRLLRRWRSPVTVARPAEAIVERLCGSGDTRPPRLRVAIEPAH